MKEASKTRLEHDSMGDVAVPAIRYWGAQTQRSLEHFLIGVGKETMPLEIVHAFGLVKHAAGACEPQVMCRSNDGGKASSGRAGG